MHYSNAVAELQAHDNPQIHLSLFLPIVGGYIKHPKHFHRPCFHPGLNTYARPGDSSSLFTAHREFKVL
jgi:hypothetical protein